MTVCYCSCHLCWACFSPGDACKSVGGRVFLFTVSMLLFPPATLARVSVVVSSSSPCHCCFGRSGAQLSPYKCMSTGFMAGLLEIVLDSQTIAHIVEKSVEGGSSGVMKKFKAAMVRPLACATVWTITVARCVCRVFCAAPVWFVVCVYACVRVCMCGIWVWAVQSSAVSWCDLSTAVMDVHRVTKGGGQGGRSAALAG